MSVGVTMVNFTYNCVLFNVIIIFIMNMWMGQV